LDLAGWTQAALTSAAEGDPIFVIAAGAGILALLVGVVLVVRLAGRRAGASASDVPPEVPQEPSRAASREETSAGSAVLSDMVEGEEVPSTSEGTWATGESASPEAEVEPASAEEPAAGKRESMESETIDEEPLPAAGALDPSAAERIESAAALVEMGKESARRGERERSYRLMRQALEMDPRNVDAWIWLAATSTSARESIACLRTALLLDPGNEKAERGLAFYEERLAREGS